LHLAAATAKKVTMSWDPKVLGQPPNRREPEDVLQELLKEVQAFMRGRLLPIVLGLVGLGGLFTTYAQVEPDEIGVLLRLGRFIGTADPGPHFRLPFGIDRIVKVPVQRQLKAEFGFRTEGSQDRVVGDVGRESLMLTGDLNVAVVEWIVQYKIKDPYQYLFKVKNVEAMLRDISEASMRAVVGDHSVNEVLTTGRQKVASEAKLLLQHLSDRYETGVDIQQVVLQDVNPPDPVKPSFNEVNQAIQEKERAINEAYAEMNREVPRARGEAEEAQRGAEGYAIERVNRARGEAERFARIYEEYRKAPDVTRKRMYLETVAKVLQKAGQKVVVDESQKGITPMLRMDAPGEASAGAASTLKEKP
jgi:modulator of FtsH protease HflK